MRSDVVREIPVKLLLDVYRPSDFEALYRIDQACYDPGISYSRRTLRGFLRLSETNCHVARIGEEIAGFIVAASDGLRAHLITIDVVASARRHGVGSALLLHAERELAHAGVRLLELETATTNEPAIAFWQKHGYRVARLYRGYYLNRIDAYLMKKRLAAAGAPEG